MRTTETELKALVRRINELTGNPVEEWSFQDNGKWTSNPGNFHLDFANGGVRLEQNVEGGGVTVPLSGGRLTKRELATELRAFIAGLTYKNE
jgi:hypothetical protein